jgi:hypothetical protein
MEIYAKIWLWPLKNPRSMRVIAGWFGVFSASKINDSWCIDKWNLHVAIAVYGQNSEALQGRFGYKGCWCAHRNASSLAWKKGVWWGKVTNSENGNERAKDVREIMKEQDMEAQKSVTERLQRAQGIHRKVIKTGSKAERPEPETQRQKAAKAKAQKLLLKQEAKAKAQRLGALIGWKVAPPLADKISLKTLL